MTNLLRRSRSLVRDSADTILARANLQIVRKSSLDTFGWNDPDTQRPPTGDEVLVDLDRLNELAGRYRDHPAAETGGLWSEAYQELEIDMTFFRADNAYLWQSRDDHLPIRYAVTALYARLFDPLKLWGRFTEDQAFGAHVVEIDGSAVSRDLLDSIVELNFLEESLAISTRKALRVIDIGAGYGRLAHRATIALPGIDYVCTDGVALSTALCEAYLRYRATQGASVAPLDTISKVIRESQFDLAVNVHSFSECPLTAIKWWVQLLADGRVPHLMVVPSGGFRSQERDGSRHDFLPVLESAGYHVVLRRPKFAHSESVQRYGIYPTEHALFELRQ